MARRAAKPDPWEGCPWIAEALVAHLTKGAARLEGVAAREAALFYTKRFAWWLFERFTVASSRNLDEFMHRLEESPTVAKLLEFKLQHPQERTPGQVAEAVGIMLERIVDAHARHLLERAPPGVLPWLSDVKTAELAGLRLDQMHGLPRRVKAQLVSQLDMELFVRRLNERLRRRPNRRRWSPVHHLADAVDQILSAAEPGERDSITVALAREVLGVETTAGKVHELRKRARGELSKSGLFPSPRP